MQIRHILVAVAIVGCGSAQKTRPAAAGGTTPGAVAQDPAPSGIDETSLDESTSPCDNFYQYACGGWLKRATIPADHSEWSRGFHTLFEKNNALEHDILEAAAKGQGEGKYTDKLGALYGSCMDEPGIEQRAATELKALMRPIDAVKDLKSLTAEIAREHADDMSPLFEFGQEQDLKDATQVIGALDQGGLGLPDRDYYLKNDGKFPELQKKYQAHVAKMFALLGEPAGQAQKDAATVMRLETLLAKASLPLVERRDPHKLYHRLDLPGVEKTAPKLDWHLYLTGVGAPEVTQINVAVPDFFVALNKELVKQPLADWKTYLRWHVVHDVAPTLSKAFVDENFDFYGRTLYGVAELEPRWKRCVQAVDHLMPQAIGEAFVKRAFSPEAKQYTLDMVHGIEAAMGKDIDTLAWMDEPTQKAAHDKLQQIANKIGFPDKWRSYDALEVTRDSYLNNALHAEAFEVKRQLDKIGKPVDRSDWKMPPALVNAQYSSSMNEMSFPAGILQPPFFDPHAAQPVNFGAIGMVVGHELTHGFDDQGRKFDGKGDLREWWTPTASKEFERRAQCVVDQFSSYVAVDNIHLNGKLTEGENLADIGGLKLAHIAYLAARRGGPRKLGRFTDEQLFFIGNAQAWCDKRRPELSRLRAATDPHSPPEFRINGPMSNLPEFAAAFSCKAGDKMVRAVQCSVW
jgi:endothelin-converting enzyme/putative endopeptidase